MENFFSDNTIQLEILLHEKSYNVESKEHFSELYKYITSNRETAVPEMKICLAELFDWLKEEWNKCQDKNLPGPNDRYLRLIALLSTLESDL
jgi:hypothetical protein